MKTLATTTILVVLTAFVFAQNADTSSETASNKISKDLEVAVIQENDNLVSLYLAKKPGEVVKIKIKEDNKVLYTRRIKKAGTARIKYDISQFPKGEYMIEVVKDKKVVYSKTIKKGSNALATSK